MKYTAEQMVEAIKGSGGLVNLVAARLGCGRATVYRYRDRYASVREALEEERAVFLDMVESRFFELIEAGNVDAILFGLRTLGKDRGYTTKVDIRAVGRRAVEELLGALERGLKPEEFARVMRIVRRTRIVSGASFTFGFDVPPEEETA